MYPHIQNARLKILNCNFSNLLHTLHEIFGKELINPPKTVPAEQKPSGRRLRDANKLKAGIERLIDERDARAVIEPVRNEVKVSVATAYATQFSMPVRKNVKSIPELKAAPETTSLVRKFFQ